MALIALAAFLLLAVGGRVALQLHWTGDHGLRPIGSGSTARAKWASALLLLTVLAVSTLALADVGGELHGRWEIGRWGALAGGSLCTAGLLVTLVSQVQMGRAWRIGVDEHERTELVTTGIYAWVRNPIYAGIMVFGVGLFALLPHPLTLAALGVGYASIEMQVRWVEEPHMRALHGESFERYTRRVRRYVPIRRRPR